ncbi:MAG: glycosyltransferase family 2 protein [Candidatus Komeilibacteria bacterium]|nr:glycosyltransferase family 2 protein [Candidatus Komeilibacteria bacterium]
MTKVIAVLPAYNAAKTLAQTVADIDRNIVDEIILVDDASTDETVATAKALGLTTIVHARNLGYGGNQKTCYQAALAAGADIVVMVHPDHQYDPKKIKEVVRPIQQGVADAVFGSRMMEKGGARRGGMPSWKYAANIFLTKIENIILGLNLTEYHSGFRAYSRPVLETVKLEANSNNFVFDTEIIIQLRNHGFRIKEIPIPTKYFKDASSVGFWRGAEYGLSIIKALGQYILHRIGLKQYNIL